MKKPLFLLFGALFLIAGCADESGTNNIVSNACPISSADFSYNEIAVNKYEIILNDENKRQYASNGRWTLWNDYGVIYDRTNGDEPIFTFMSPLNKKEIAFYYNNTKCGDNIILKPNPINQNPDCNNILINYQQRVNFAEPESSFYVQFQDINQLDNNLTYSIKFTDNKTLEREPDTIFDNSIVFRAMYSEIEHLRSYIGGSNGEIFADLIINYSDGSQCIKELYFENMF